MGRPEARFPEEATPLTEFAGRLRAMREAAGRPPYRRLAAVTHYSAATLARAADGQRLPSLEVTLAYVAGCGGDPGEWKAAWAEVAEWVRSRADTAVPAPGPVPRIADKPAAPRIPVPAQLPADTADFTGREAQLEKLCGLLGADPDPDRPGAVVTAVVAGMPGVGKTALAVHAAHRLRDQFPDGQLFAALQGASNPLRPAEVLASFLRALGVPDSGIPAGEAERAARYRSLLADRRMLVVLDDARDAAQVRPLLPGTARCAVLMTSRRALAVLPGVLLLSLEVLEPAEGRALFNAVAGSERAAAEPEAARTLLVSCGGLPLAIRIAAGRLVTRPGWSVAHLAALLTGERDRLAELTTGDLAVRASFAVSYDALAAAAPDPARVFRLLGLPKATVLSLPAIAALADEPERQVATSLEALADAFLVETPAPSRFRLHDLLRSYAADLAAATGSAADRTAALGRMFRWYAEQAVIAARVLAPARRLPFAVTSGVAAPPGLTRPEQALDWYETERANLLNAAGHAAELGMHETAARIAVAMSDYFLRTHHREARLTVSEIGVNSARQLGDNAVLSWLLNTLGGAHNMLGQFSEARQVLTEALDIRSRTGDLSGQGTVFNSLATVAYAERRHEEALGYLQSAWAISTALGESQYVALILNNTAENLLCLGRPEVALEHLERALATVRESGDQHWCGMIENTLGRTCLELGRAEDAVSHYRNARAALRDTARSDSANANALYGLGTALAALGRTSEAHQEWLTALPILDQLHDPRAAELRERLAPETT